jgi:hypothetical protein
MPRRSIVLAIVLRARYRFPASERKLPVATFVHVCSATATATPKQRSKLENDEHDSGQHHNWGLVRCSPKIQPLSQRRPSGDPHRGSPTNALERHNWEQVRCSPTTQPLTKRAIRRSAICGQVEVWSVWIRPAVGDPLRIARRHAKSTAFGGTDQMRPVSHPSGCCGDFVELQDVGKSMGLRSGGPRRSEEASD